MVVREEEEVEELWSKQPSACKHIVDLWLCMKPVIAVCATVYFGRSILALHILLFIFLAN